MILDKIHSQTGLPLVQETRGGARWSSLSRDLAKVARRLKRESLSPWHPDHHIWNGSNLQETLCWKCGVALKGWRIALDRDGNRVQIEGSDGIKRSAVAFLDYPHKTSTLFSIQLPMLDRMAVFQVHHCQDCSIMVEDGMSAWACCLGGTDDILQHQTKNGLAHVNRDVWATHLYRYAGADPQGPTTLEAAMNFEMILSPGDTLTSAALSVLTDSAQRNKIPAGVIVEFKGDIPPVGWKMATRKGKIEKL